MVIIDESEIAPPTINHPLMPLPIVYTLDNVYTHPYTSCTLPLHPTLTPPPVDPPTDGRGT